MDRTEFIRMLEQEGYQEFVTVERGPHATLGLHTHPFEARALILLGELRLVTGEQEQVCQTGDQFHLAAHIPHSETCGAEGVHYLVGRKPG
nr:cupin domain-containing protein [uncultured Noviherbaspirillum sp.]